LTITGGYDNITMNKKLAVTFGSKAYKSGLRCNPTNDTEFISRMREFGEVRVKYLVTRNRSGLYDGLW